MEDLASKLMSTDLPAIGLDQIKVTLPYFILPYFILPYFILPYFT